MPPLLLAAIFFLEGILKKHQNLKLILLPFLVLIIFFEKRRFYIDLRSLNPHVKCVRWGKEIRGGKKKPIVISDNIEDIKTCPPFTNFYANKAVEFRLKE